MGFLARIWPSGTPARRQGKRVFFLARFCRVLTVVSTLLAGARAQNGAPAEYQVKASFLSSFAKFVEWPPEGLSGRSARLQICILGQDGFGNELENVTRGETVKGHRVEIIHNVEDLPQIHRCHILFVSGSATRQFHKLHQGLRGRSILTVGESADFIEQGGMINFVREGRMVLFEINVTAAQEAGLKVSAKLLRVAKAVTGPGSGQGQ